MRRDDGRICFTDCGQENCMCKGRINVNNQLGQDLKDYMKWEDYSKQRLEQSVAIREEEHISKSHLDEMMKYIYTNNGVDAGWSDSSIGTTVRSRAGGERTVRMMTGCSTYGSINTMEYCDSNACTNCRKREKQVLDEIQKTIKIQYPNIENNE